MDDVNLMRDLARMIDQFRQAGALVVQGADFRRVLDVFGDFELEKNLVQECRAGSVYPDSASVESIFVVAEEALDTVTSMQMEFKEGITLGALEHLLGAWYRDPPEPEEASFTSAYFKPQQIAADGEFFLYAVIEEFCDRYTPHTLVYSLNLGFQDDRYVTDRPW